ncbi:acyl-CoA dehydrogenase family protein [Streptomyces sp. NPDC058217]|uniref:acyl-CoA dehydrogenase family protein n=1 Tax=Streptomyces sp. NPDC058217 TaxID=3346384 RepID=UPI0036E8B3EE
MAQQSTRAFGMPLAAFQHRLSRMLADNTDMLSMQYRLSQLLDEGDYSMPRVAPAKMHDTERARGVLAHVRDTLGGNGNLLDHHGARHLCDRPSTPTRAPPPCRR